MVFDDFDRTSVEYNRTPRLSVVSMIITNWRANAAGHIREQNRPPPVTLVNNRTTRRTMSL
jgi:hypothetical protein